VATGIAKEVKDAVARVPPFLRRLDRLRLPAEKEPKKVRNFGVLSRIENARLQELYDTLRDEDEEITEGELEELRGLLSKMSAGR
jgi:hypothetical protein